MLDAFAAFLRREWLTSLLTIAREHPACADALRALRDGDPSAAELDRALDAGRLKAKADDLADEGARLGSAA